MVEAQASGLPCIISDRITKDVQILDSTKMLPIEGKDIQMWCDRIDSLRNYERHDTYKEMRAAGFDIHGLCEKLVDFYINSIE